MIGEGEHMGATFITGVMSDTGYKYSHCSSSLCQRGDPATPGKFLETLTVYRVVACGEKKSPDITLSLWRTHVHILSIGTAIHEGTLLS